MRVAKLSKTVQFYIEHVIQRFIKDRSSRFDLSPLGTTTMGRTNLHVISLLVITLSEAFLGSGRLSTVHFRYF